MTFEYQKYNYDANQESGTYEALAKHSKIYGYISQTLNNPRILHEVMELTGEKDLIGFWGRLYRLEPDGNQRFDWHKDIDTGKRIAVSINISPKPFTGGELIFRLEGRPESEIKIHNVGEGDAVFFLIDRAYEHKVLPLSGEASKYAITGWFQTMAPPPFSVVYA
ncbi:MAG: 2OG-Fe(II) oxygenase [Bacteriovoracaceae bacterium]